MSKAPTEDAWVATSDEELLGELNRDDVRALGALYERHHERVYALCYRLTGDPQAAYDLVHESFLRVLKYGKGFRGEAAFTSWLHRLVRNVCVDYHRSEERRRARASAWASERVLDSAESGPTDPHLDRLRSALYSLPPDKREVLVLSRYEGLSYAEIATICDSTVGAIKVRAHRALRELRARFEELRRTP